MRKHFLIYLVFFVLISFNVKGQKKDYKDISPLVISRQYKIAKPLLSELLKEHPDFPVANLYAGKIYHDIFSGYDFIADSSGFFSYYDSAKYYYQRYKTLGNEKDIRKNDDFYKEFYRRDLRTGEYDIKLSDIIVEIDQSIDKMDDHKREVVDLHRFKMEVEKEYSVLLKKVKGHISTFLDYNEFILLEDSTLIPEFQKLSNLYVENLEKRKLASNKVIILGQEQYANTSADIKTLKIEEIKGVNFPGIFINEKIYYPDLGYFLKTSVSDLDRVLQAKNILYSAFDTEQFNENDINDAQHTLDEFNENGLISSLIKFKVHKNEVSDSFKDEVFDSLSSKEIIPILQEHVVALAESKILLSDVSSRNTDFERSIHLNFIYKEFYGKVEFNKWIKKNLSTIENAIDSLNSEIDNHYFRSRYVVYESDTFPIYSTNDIENKEVMYNYNEGERTISLGFFSTQDSSASRLGIYLLDSDSLLKDYKLKTEFINDSLATEWNIKSFNEKIHYKEGTAFIHVLSIKGDTQKFLKIIYNTDPLLVPIEYMVIRKEEFEEVRKKKVKEKSPEYEVLR
ncbi:hypothetical protein OO013_10365 [Mangrovivirga sp. M17]|uniref:Uncharacterized protein n=1 Tax=Mangrovivirga halotolerans TaxID=2993936 RepID=A0ABT3RR63_9BACT|nr:hypothetical protein [Mangrovivirga halotolerans]MCX2744272.1 hypothetical protein [Mangrovivirga halotolerans]